MGKCALSQRMGTTATLDELRTRELVKYSPIKVLTDEQGALICEILNHPDKNYVINDAGQARQSFSRAFGRKCFEKSARCKNRSCCTAKLGKDGGQYFQSVWNEQQSLVQRPQQKLITSRESTISSL